MADSKNAEIKIRTLDETGSGFQSVSTRFENFDQQVQNLEKNLKPLEEILKAGVEASGALSGLGTVPAERRLNAKCGRGNPGVSADVSEAPDHSNVFWQQTFGSCIPGESSTATRRKMGKPTRPPRFPFEFSA